MLELAQRKQGNGLGVTAGFGRRGELQLETEGGLAGGTQRMRAESALGIELEKTERKQREIEGTSFVKCFQKVEERKS